MEYEVSCDDMLHVRSLGQDRLSSLADQALAEHRAGRTKALDPDGLLEVHSSRPICSVRVSIGYRALALRRTRPGSGFGSAPTRSTTGSSRVSSGGVRPRLAAILVVVHSKVWRSAE